MPDAVALAYALAAADYSKAASFLQRKAGGVRCDCRCLDRPDAALLGRFDQRGEQCSSDALAARYCCDVDSCFGNAGVAGSLRYGAESGPTENRPGIVARDQPRMG